MRVVDEVAKGDVTAVATAFARRVVAEKRPLALARERDEAAALRADPGKLMNSRQKRRGASADRGAGARPQSCATRSNCRLIVRCACGRASRFGRERIEGAASYLLRNAGRQGGGRGR